MGTFRSFSPCSETPEGTASVVDFLRGDLFRMAAHHQMDLVGRAINLREQALQINRAAGSGRGDDEFHCA